MTTPIGNIPTSSIPAVRAYLLAQFQAQLPKDPNDPSVDLLVCTGEPGTFEPGDIVAIGDVHQTYSPESSVGSGGAYWLREDYTVNVTVDCVRGGDDEPAVFTRARSLADWIVNIVRSDPSLGGAVDRGRPGAVSHTSNWTDDHAGRQVVIDIAIDCLKTL